MKAGLGVLAALIGLVGVLSLDPMIDGLGIYALFCALPPLGFFVAKSELT